MKCAAHEVAEDPALTPGVQELASAAANTAGLSLAAMDGHIFEAALKRRMRATTANDVFAYVALHRKSAAEREAYLEEVLIGETSFFRDVAVFAEMSRWAVNRRASHPGPIRILSAPCSTGEEPYSIAASLLEAGVPAEDFIIDAVDISALAIEHARAGVYHGFALRNIAEPGNAAFLQPEGNGWKVRDHVRRRVYFKRANLLEEGLFAGQTYDLIFARNLLIYGTSRARRYIVSVLAQALAADGRLVVGSADWGTDLQELFTLEQPVHSFALRLKDADQPAVSMPAPAASLHENATLEPIRMQSARPSIETSGMACEQVAGSAELTRLAQSADARGESGTAEWICRQALYLDPENLQALELLGRLERPRLTRRMHLALHARLHRLRNAAAGQETT